MTSADSSSSLQSTASFESHPQSYTPVLSSVKLISSRVASNGLVRSSLQKLQSIVPESVSAQAVSAAGQAAQMSDRYAAPLVNRVDSGLSTYIVKILSLPAYGSAKVQQADELAFAYTPESLKGAYTTTRQRVTSTLVRAREVSDRTVETVQRVKTERTQAMWSALEQLQVQIASVKAAVAQTSTQARQALDLHTRLTELQAKITQAIGIANEKRAQARHLSQEILASLTDLTQQLTTYIDSNLSEGQRDLVHTYWARLLEGVNALKESLHLGGASASPADSRSDSSASEVEGVVAAAVAKIEANGEQVLTEAVDAADQESESKTAGSSGSKKTSAAYKRANKSSAAKKPTTTAASSMQQEDEQKQKVAAEDE